jgi:hypothetical protein
MYSIQNNVSYILVSFNGNLNDSDLQNAIDAVETHPDYPVKNDIWVFSDCLPFLSYSSFAAIVQRIADRYPASALRSKTAIVTTKGYNTALASIFKREADRLPYNIDIFSNVEQASQWIMSTGNCP